MKKAFITGITGQDGYYLSKFLLENDYEVHGIIRRASSFNTTRLDPLISKYSKDKQLNLYYSDLLDSSSLSNLILKISPDEIYNLAAQSHVAVSFKNPIYTTESGNLGTISILEAIRNMEKEIRFYQASSSEMYGGEKNESLNEKSKFNPKSPYAASKVFSHYITVNYRESYDLFACSGILFNHESPLRGEEFVTKKIARSLAQIKKGQLKQMLIGNVDVKRDWGYAGDYVDAMWRMLNAKTAKDYVISSEKTHSVREFIDKTTDFLGMKCEWQGEGIDTKLIDKSSSQIIVKVDKTFFRPAEVDLLLGDSSLAKEDLKWEPTISFEQLIEMMVEYELEKIK